MTQQNSPVALITGGSRGIGRSTALTLASRGTDVIVTYVSAEQEANDVVQAVRERGRRAVALRLDLTQTGSFDGFAQNVRQVLAEVWAREHFDYLVNGGGFGGAGAFLQVTEEAFDALADVHFKGPFFLTQKLLPLLAEGARIVNVTSGVTRYTFPGVSVYAAVKSALEAVTRALALELAPRQIAVNAVAPGAIRTDFGGGYLHDPDFQRAVVADTPLGRVGEPDDVADLIAALLSTDTRWVTGQRIEATGGYRL